MKTRNDPTFLPLLVNLFSGSSAAQLKINFCTANGSEKAIPGIGIIPSDGSASSGRLVSV